MLERHLCRPTTTTTTKNPELKRRARDVIRENTSSSTSSPFSRFNSPYFPSLSGIVFIPCCCCCCRAIKKKSKRGETDGQRNEPAVWFCFVFWGFFTRPTSLSKSTSRKESYTRVRKKKNVSGHKKKLVPSLHTQ